MISRNDPCWCGSGKKWKKCHYPTEMSNNRSELVEDYLENYGIILKNPEQIEGIRSACQLAATILDQLCSAAKKGVTTNKLNDLAVQLHKKAGAKSAPLGYGDPPFPKSICTSLNDVICHGIPDDTPLKDGDIMNIDVTCILNGYYGDCSRMVCIGEIDEEKKLVVETSLECLNQAIAICKPGVRVSDIGKVIQSHAHSKNCSVVHQFVAHGVGIEFHEPPQIPHCVNRINTPLAPGMSFTIEPMINAGVAEGLISEVDHWTATTEDHRPSAQWEHTILITETGHEILTEI